MATNQIYTIIERSRGVKSEFTGTVAELQRRFEGTLKAGNFYDRKVKLAPQNIMALVDSLNLTAKRLLMGGDYRLA
jgi:hypothetical protein